METELQILFTKY